MSPASITTYRRAHADALASTSAQAAEPEAVASEGQGCDTSYFFTSRNRGKRARSGASKLTCDWRSGRTHRVGRGVSTRAQTRTSFGGGVRRHPSNVRPTSRRALDARPVAEPASVACPAQFHALSRVHHTHAQLGWWRG